MAYLLPKFPDGKTNFTFISNFTDLQPSGGGAVQRINSLGDRFKLEHTIALNGVQGMGLVADVNANLGSKVRVHVPQAFDIGSPGVAVQTNGANAGRTLNVKGLSPNYAFRKGQFVTVLKSGKRYLHQLTADVTANASGVASLPIVPMLRTPLTGNETVEVAEPTLEGFLTSREQPWVLGLVRSVTLTITVAEAE